MVAASAKGMLNKSLFVAVRTPLDLSRFQDFLQAHLQWVIAAEKRGEVFASGPFVGDAAAPGSLGGMTILRAASLAEARQILSEDPFVSNGIYSVEVRQWLLMEGGFSINVTFSDQNYRLL